MSNINDEQEIKFLTVKETAFKLNMSKNSIYRLADHGQIPCYRIGSSLRFDENDVNKFINNTYCRPAAL